MTTPTLSERLRKAALPGTARNALDCEAADTIDRLREECARLRADAERYRWLREQQHEVWSRIGWNTWNNDPACWPMRDAAIDAALKGTP